MLLANMLDSHLWYAVPLIISISLVYGATRHEGMREIMNHSLRAGGWMVGFMLIIFVLLSLLSWGL